MRSCCTVQVVRVDWWIQCEYILYNTRKEKTTNICNITDFSKSWCTGLFYLTESTLNTHTHTCWKKHLSGHILCYVSFGIDWPLLPPFVVNKNVQTHCQTRMFSWKTYAFHDTENSSNSTNPYKLLLLMPVQFFHKTRCFQVSKTPAHFFSPMCLMDPAAGSYPADFASDVKEYWKKRSKSKRLPQNNPPVTWLNCKILWILDESDVRVLTGSVDLDFIRKHVKTPAPDLFQSRSLEMIHLSSLILSYG